MHFGSFSPSADLPSGRSPSPRRVWRLRRPRLDRRPFALTVAASVALVVLMAIPPLSSRPAATPVTTTALAGILPDSTTVYNVSYKSSVDGFPLSYAEILPAGYTNSTSWPLLV